MGLLSNQRAYPDSLYVKHFEELFCFRYRAPNDPNLGRRIGPKLRTARGASTDASCLNGEGPLDWDVNSKEEASLT